MEGKKTYDLPPGFRFHPTDEELIMYYLKNQAISNPCPVSIIPEVDIYKFDPWDLPEKSESAENEWYFFTPRDRKYPNGIRPNRAALSGYWKATGTDKAIYSGSKYVGVKKSLVFYRGKPPKGIKTDWIMHEYRLSDSRRSLPNKHNGSMRLDDWVLCRIYLKKNTRAIDIKVEDSSDHDHISSTTTDNAISEVHQDLKLLPRTCSVSHLWEFDHLGSMNSLSHIFNDNPYHATFDDQPIASSQGNMQNQEAMKFQVNNQGSLLSNKLHINNIGFGFQ